ncbi:DUF4387 domain-containing protein [Clostridiales bacterium COT073_COT-073]|nr:DUF4387 domain-containing protein [Clostridiales bacterium COT073_COT-073]
MKKSLYELASVIRSKNSGPFQITLDVLFEEEKIYETVKRSGQITRQRIAQIYQIDEQKIRELVFFDPALGFKITFDRTISSGTCFDTDVYGAQQHVPLGEIMIPV